MPARLPSLLTEPSLLVADLWSTLLALVVVVPNLDLALLRRAGLGDTRCIIKLPPEMILSSLLTLPSCINIPLFFGLHGSNLLSVRPERIPREFTFVAVLAIVVYYCREGSYRLVLRPVVTLLDLGLSNQVSLRSFDRSEPLPSPPFSK